LAPSLPWAASGRMADGAADEAFGRVAELLQRTAGELSGHFAHALEAVPAVAAGAWPRPAAVEVLRSQEAQEDIAVVRAAGDGELLEEVALDLLEESVRRHVIPRLWRRAPPPLRGAGAGRAEKLCAAWGHQLRGAASALRALHSAHGGVLGELQAPGAKQLARRHAMALSIAFTETLPASFAEQAHHYLRWTWQRCSPQGRGRRHEPPEEEWWWAPTRGEPAAATPAARIAALLNPARRPPAASGDGAADVDEELLLVEADDQCPGGFDAGMLSSTKGEEEADEEDDEDEDQGAGVDAPPCTDASAEGLRVISEALQCMGLGGMWRDLVMRFAVEELGSTVEKRCSSEYDAKGLLDQLTAWLYSPLLRWLRTAYGLPAMAGRWKPAGNEAEVAWWVAARQVVLQFFETFVEVRIREAFDMVRDFPDSVPALLDLRRCLARTGRSAPLVRALRQQLARRLLIAGAHTRDVIQVYIKTIKAMRLVDPRGLLLEAVSAPIRAYLKRRKDTIRCIVTALTEDSDLQLELHLGAESGRPRAAKAGAAPGDGAGGEVAGAGAPAGGGGRAVAAMAGSSEPPDFAFGGADFDVSEDEEDPDSWTPDPIDADPLLPSRQRRAQDAVSLLVGIYGSKEMFIKEYKEMLADRLLGNPSYSTEREMQNLELLKTRFGEAALTHCEVMLQDIKDSKRVNGNVQQLSKARQPAAAAKAASVLPFRSPPRAGAQAAPGTGQRGFAAPFSLSSMFGLCLSPQAAGGGAPSSSPQPPPDSEAVTVLTSPGPAGPGDGGAAAVAAGEEGQRLSLEQMHALVLSQHYWPSALAKADHPNFRLPASLEEALAEYSGAYAQTRARRSLQWKRVHGLVEMTVQLADRSIPVVVSPVHYAVLACFTDRASGSDPAAPTAAASAASPRLSLQEVAAQVDLPEALVRKRLGFWVAKGVLREVSAGAFGVQESLSTMESAGANHLDEDAEHSPGQAAARPGGGGGRDAGSAAELKVCEAFVQVVLTSNPALPLGRIHNSLQTFMADPQYTQTETQLRDFLGQLCQEGKLEFDGSSYSLAKRT